MARPTVAELVAKLQLLPHPEGGFYRETFRDAGTVEGGALPPAYRGAPRSFSTAIFFLVPFGAVSKLHRITSAECWHFYLGQPLTVTELAPDGAVTHTQLGTDFGAGQTPQHVVPGGHWFGSCLAVTGDAQQPPPLPAAEERRYALVGCTVAPGFDFADFEMASRGELLGRFPHAADDITRLTDSE